MTVLVLVESPAKCRKIESFLGSGYRVMASFGHVRDLPNGRMGVEFQGDRVIPQYVETDRGKEIIARLRVEARRAELIVLASDPDREGEAIAWHLTQALGPHRYERATFNAITSAAVRHAIANPRAVDLRLVDSQQARRILDRVVGFLVSPTCARGTGMKEARSAGRVQSVALRLVVEREREIRAFKPITYYVPVATVAAPGKPPAFTASLIEWKGEPLEQRLTDRVLAEKTVDWCRRQPWRVTRAEKKEQKVPPPPPFTTATLQQAASVRLKIAPAQSMRLAQELYESGAITYMRTDAVALTKDAVEMARAFIKAHTPPLYLPAEPRIFSSRSEHAQEAHEAVRPTHAESGPDAHGMDLKGRLYRLVWERFIACQMADGRDSIAVIDVGVAPESFEHPTRGRIPMGIFRAKGTIVLFDGWRRLTDDAADDVAARRADDEEAKAMRLPELDGDEQVILREMGAKEKTTKAPPRYTEAGLIKVLERRGVGRPSTYATIMSVILGRGYVAEKQRKLHATDLGMALSGFLERGYAGNFIEPDFTSRVEADLDRIARGDLPWGPFVAKLSEQVLALARAAGLSYNPLAGEKPPWASSWKDHNEGNSPPPQVPNRLSPKISTPPRPRRRKSPKGRGLGPPSDAG